MHPGMSISQRLSPFSKHLFKKKGIATWNASCNKGNRNIQVIASPPISVGLCGVFNPRPPLLQGLLWNNKCSVERCVLHMTAIYHYLAVSFIPFHAVIILLWLNHMAQNKNIDVCTTSLEPYGQLKSALLYLFITRALKMNGSCSWTSTPPHFNPPPNVPHFSPGHGDAKGLWWLMSQIELRTWGKPISSVGSRHLFNDMWGVDSESLTFKEHWSTAKR